MSTATPSLTANFSIAAAKDAIRKAEGYLHELFPDIATQFQFEEIKFERLPEPHWAFTFSYKVEGRHFPEYKIVEIDPETLELKGVKMR